MRRVWYMYGSDPTNAKLCWDAAANNDLSSVWFRKRDASKAQGVHWMASWPKLVLTRARSPDATDFSGNFLCIVSDKARQLIEHAAPRQAQFLPFVPCFRHRPLGVFWVMTPLWQPQCIRQHQTARSIMSIVDIDQLPQNAHVFCDEPDGRTFFVDDVLKNLIEKAGLTGVYFVPAKTEQSGKKPLPTPEIVYPQFPAPTTDKIAQAIADAKKQASAKRAATAAAKAAAPGAAELIAVESSEYFEEKGKGASARDMNEITKLCGTLPAQYAAFLRHFGWIRFSGFEVLGVPGTKPADPRGAAAATKDFRKDFKNWPSHMLCIAEDGAGGCYCLDCKAGTVHLFDHELWDPNAKAPKFKRLAKSLPLWLKRIAKTGMPE